MMRKKSIVAALEDPRHPKFSLVNDTLAAATIISILVLVAETVPSLESYRAFFVVVEWVTVTLFTLEYSLRFWAAKPRRTYALSFFGIIDLVAILPTFIGLGNFTFLKSARVVRIIRFLRIIRLAKLTRIRTDDAEETFGILGFNIAIYGCALTAVLLIIGVLLHVFVSNDGQYWSIPAGMYWAFSVFLGGLPAPIPPGSAGTTIFIIAKFCGMALFGLLVGIVGKMFNELVLGKR